MGRITRGRGSDRYLEHIRGRYESPSREWSPKEIGQVLKVAKDAYTHPLLRDAVTGIEVLLKDQGSLEDPGSKASKGQLKQAAEARQKPSWEASEEELRAKRIAARDPGLEVEAPTDPQREPLRSATWKRAHDVRRIEPTLPEPAPPSGPRYGTASQINKMREDFQALDAIGIAKDKLDLAIAEYGGANVPQAQALGEKRERLNYDAKKQKLIQDILKNPRLLTSDQKLLIKNYKETGYPRGKKLTPKEEVLYEVMLSITGQTELPTRYSTVEFPEGHPLSAGDPGVPPWDPSRVRHGSRWISEDPERHTQEGRTAAFHEARGRGSMDAPKLTAREQEMSDARAEELARREILREDEAELQQQRLADYERAQAEAMVGQTIPPEEVVERLTVTEGVTHPGAKPPSYPYDVIRPRPTPTQAEIERAARESVGTAQEITRRGVEWLPQYTEELLRGNPTFNAASPEGKAHLREAVTKLMQLHGGPAAAATQTPGINTDSLISQMRGKHITQAEILAHTLGAQLGTANPASQLALQTMIENAYGLGGVSWSAEGGTLGYITPNEAGERLRDAYKEGAKLQSRQMSEEDRILKTARAYKALASARGREQKTEIERQKAPGEAHIIWLRAERLAMQNWKDAHKLVKKRRKGKKGPKKQDINKYLEDTKRLVTAKRRLYHNTLVNYQRADAKAHQILSTIDSGATLPESGSDEWIELFGADRSRYQRLITDAQTDKAAAQKLKQHIVTAAKKRRTQRANIQSALDSTAPMLDNVTRRARHVLLEGEEPLSESDRIKLIKAVADQVVKLPVVAGDDK